MWKKEFVCRIQSNTGAIALDFTKVQIGLDMAGHSKQSDAEGGKNSQERQELKELIRFEKLLSDLSVTFINLPSGEVDKEIENGLEPISDSSYR